MKTIIDFTNKVKSLVDGRISNIANVEESPSTHAYTVGKQLIFNGLLCKATSAIAVGDTLAVGTNLALSDNVVEQIYSLNQGLTNSLNEIADMNNVLGAKNILPNVTKTQTVNGITTTLNSDGSITINGTSTGWEQDDILKGLLKKGTYKISIGTPFPTHVYGTLRNDDTDTTILNLGNGSNITEQEFTLSTDTNIRFYNGVSSGVTVSNLTFYPMIRLASIQDDTYVPYSMTNREMTAYVQAISNPNLLDNPWFTVNQRGQSSYSSSSSGYTVDRWKIGYGDVICNVTNDGITLSSSILGSNFVQYIEEDYYNKFIAGKDVTLSVLLTDGTIKSVTGHAPVNTSYYQNAVMMYITNTCTIVVVGKTGENEQVQLRFAEANSDSVSIRAIKLELGSVSTLAMDTAPNYQQELAKCQRYFFNANMANTNFSEIGYGFYDNGYHFVNVPTPVPMRETPTVSMGGTVRAFIDGTRYFISDYSISVSGKNDTSIKIAIRKSDSNLPVYSLGAYSFDNINGLLMFSADL